MFTAVSFGALVRTTKSIYLLVLLRRFYLYLSLHRLHGSQLKRAACRSPEAQAGLASLCPGGHDELTSTLGD